MYPFSIFGTGAPAVASILSPFNLIFSEGLRTLIEVNPESSRIFFALFEQTISIFFLNFINDGIWQWSGKP